jgi:hypothetical protein
LEITWGIYTRNRKSKRYTENFHKFLGAAQLFQDSNFLKSYLPQIRGSSWHKNEIKMIKKGHYSSNNFQDSNKRKITKKKTLGSLLRVLFFNAFELGAEIGNQVISSDEASSS